MPGPEDPGPTQRAPDARASRTGEDAAGAGAGADGGPADASAAQDGAAADLGAGLVITGTSPVNQIDPNGLVRSQGPMTLTNTSAVPLTVARAPIFLLSRGGMAWKIGDPVSETGTFFGDGPVVGPGARFTHNLFFNWNHPISHWLFRLEAKEPGVPATLSLVPAVRPGFAEPAPVKVDDVFWGLEEPIEVLPLSTGATWLTLLGRLVNTTEKPLTLTRFSVTLTRASGVVFDSDLTQTFHASENTSPTLSFLYGYTLPAGFTTGTVAFSAELTVLGQARTVRASAAVASVRPPLLRPPVQGRWSWQDGPGELRLEHPYYFQPTRRHGYNLKILDDVDGGARKTFRGDPTLNESYLCFGQPFFAVADGAIVDVVDDVPDNLGNRANPANTPRRSSQIVVQHAQGRFTVYRSVRQASAKVKKGQPVKAGDMLGEVGNAGDTFEPQLSIYMYELEESGRPQAVAMSFTGLTTLAGQPVSGVPKGGTELLTGP
jgi:hypothetical protein